MWPAANVGIPTGAESGLVVVDVDGRNGGRQTLAGLELPDTLTVETGDGLHFYYQHPGGAVPSNSGILPGIDRKADGGYVVAPPSLHANGRRYRFTDDHPLAALPAFCLNGKQSSFATGTPGARIPQGKRNATLASLGGTMRAKGITEDAIRAALLAENAARCDPPLGEADVARIAASVARYAPAEPDTPIVFGKDKTPAAEWPPDAAPAAFYGLLGDVVRAVEPYTEADPHGVLTGLAAGFGNAAGDGPHCFAGEDRHTPRIFGLTVGESSKSRKGSAWALDAALLRRADPAWADAHILSGLSSGEGLIFAVRDAVTRHDAIKEHSRVVGYQDVEIDAGITDKRLLVVESEFGRTLKVAGREGNVLTAVLRQAFDSGDLRVMTKTPAKATGAHISILGMVTKDELARELSSTDLVNGLANRFVFQMVRRSKRLPDGGRVPPGVFAALAERIAEALEFAKDCGQMARDDEARDRWREVYPDLSGDRLGMFGAATARAEAHVLRLSMIYALADLCQTIGRPHLDAALALWKRAEDSARYLFGDKTGDSIADAIIGALRAQGEMSATDVSNLFARHVKAERIAAALASLLGAGLVECDQIETGGRHATMWKAAER
jgi:hypothetical protein